MIYEDQMTEADLQSLVLEYCLRRKVLAYHTHDSRKSQRGFPDLVLVGDRGVLYAELKTEKGKPTPEQMMWADALTTAERPWQLWRPRMWTDGTIQKQIDALGTCSAYVIFKRQEAEAKAKKMLADRRGRLR